ncbi:MAG: MFS transporter, partial [Chloroflexota bacterium]
YLLMSLIAELWQFYVCYGLIVGIAISFALVPLTSTVSRWFTARRGLALGIAVTGIGLGTVVMAPIAQALISGFGWRQSYVILSLLVLAIVVPLSLTLFPNPATKGLRPYGDRQDPAAATTTAFAHQPASLDVRQAIRTGTFWRLVVIFVMFVLCHQIVIVHIVPHATDLGMSPLQASAILSLIGLWATAAKVTFGLASDKIGCKRTLLMILAIMAASMILLATVKQQWSFYLFAVLFGFGYGGYSALYPATVGEYFGTKHYGSVFGTMLAFSGLSGSTGPLLAGYVYDVTGKYDLAFLGAGIATLAALMAGLSLRPVGPRRTR